MKKYLSSPCPACGDPINVCNENPDTNHYELIVDPDTGEVIGESERMFKGEKMGGMKEKAKDKNIESNLEQNEEEQKVMFDLSKFKPNDSDKHYTTHQCLSHNAMMFLELASEKAFELLNTCFDDDDEDLEELRFLFTETKISLDASNDI